jgi:pyruvate/2-oxoglutarate dehydrogenase complex dihydrolipoamide acyltransferase (E2) component
MTERKTKYQITPFPRLQRQMIDWLDLQRRQNAVHILLEVDVTQARRNISAYRSRTGGSMSLTAFITACFARSIDENKLLHAYRMGRGQLVLFEDVDVTVAVEREVEGQKIPVPLIIREANKKSFGEIDREIKTAKTGGNPQSRGMHLLPFWLLLPPFVRRFIWKRLLSNPHRRKRISGTTMMTNAGMFGSGTGWGISPSLYTATLLVGSIATKPGVVDERIEVREYLCLTVTVDHDIVDGAVAARFAARLKELIQSGGGLLEENQDSAPTSARLDSRRTTLAATR